MAERIVSPGVFTREKDLSFLPQGISDIGAALIGPTEMGPAFVPTQIRNMGEFETIFGKENQDFYVPFTAKQYLRSAGTVTIVRVMGLGGYANDTVVLGISGSFGHLVAATLKPSRGATTPDSTEIAGPTSASIVMGVPSASTFTLNLDTNNAGETSAFALSFDSSSANYITKVFSEDPQDANQAVYVYSNFQHTQNRAGANDAVTVQSGSDEAFSFDYNEATTPAVQSQLVNSARTDLFKVKTRSHGSNLNSKYKIGISNIKRPVDVAGSDYGSFSLQVMINNPGELDDGTILENFDNLSFDEDSVNYLPRAIGDKYTTIDSNGKLTNNGDYVNQSQYIYISNYGNLTGINEELVPMGFGKVLQPHNTTLGTPSGSTIAVTFPSASFVGTSVSSGQKNNRGTFDQNVFYGFDFNNVDNQQYLAPLPTSAAVGNNLTMSLEDAYGNDDASTLGTQYSAGDNKLSLSGSDFRQLKFQVPFQGGFDGVNPATDRKTGTNISTANSQGFDFTDANASGSVAFKRAINAVSNPDEFDINLLSTRGIIHGLGGGHSAVTNHAIDKVEDRADTFYIMDGSVYGRTIQGAINDVKTIDSNYVGTY